MYFSLKSLYGFFFFFFFNFFSQGPNRRNRKFPVKKILLSAHLVHEKLLIFWESFLSLFWNQIWDKVFKNGPSKICGTMSLKHLKGYGLLEADHNPSDSLKTVFHKFYLIHSRILCSICSSKWQYLPDNARYIFLT